MVLLEQTRSLNKVIQKSKDSHNFFEEITALLSDLTDSNVYVIGAKGKIVTSALQPGFVSNIKEISEEYHDVLMSYSAPISNLDDNDGKHVLEVGNEGLGSRLVSIIPVIGGGQRVATLLLAKFDGSFSEESEILVEYAGGVFGIAIARSIYENSEMEIRKKVAVQIAVGTLSYSELEAIKYIFEELNGPEGILVASKIADKAGITRSVIVNALRKLESANVIESKSLGMKGTYIRVLNSYFLDEVNKLK